MYSENIQKQTLINPSIPQNNLTMSETELEQTIGLSLLDDYNTQLNNIALSMQNNLFAKKEVQAELRKIQELMTRNPQNVEGASYFVLTHEEYEDLKQKYPQLRFLQTDKGPLVSKDALDRVGASLQQKLAEMNTDTEMQTLQIQSLVDQRKQSLVLLSNLIENRNEIMMSIVGNLK